MKGIDLHYSRDNFYTADVKEYCMTVTEAEDPEATFDMLTIDDFDVDYKKYECVLYLVDYGDEDDDTYKVIKEKCL